MKKWIFKECQKHQNSQIIVLTHHAPSFKMIDKRNDISDFYCSNIDDDIKILKNVRYWLSGHTHQVKETQIGNVICKSNCHGDKYQNIVGYNPLKYVIFY